MTKGLRVSALFVGFISDVLLSNIAGVILGVLLAASTIKNGHMDQVAFKALAHSFGVELIGLALGGFGTLVGGFLTGWIAGANRMKNVYALAVVEVIFGCAIVPFGSTPIWVALIGIPASIVCAVLGGLIATAIFGEKAITRPPV